MKFLTPLALLATPAIAAQEGITDRVTISDCSPAIYSPIHLICAVTNHTDAAIASLEIGHRITQPGRSVAWLDTTETGLPFGPGTIPGGIEPGETISLEVRTPPMSDRADPDLIQIELIPLRATTAAGEVIE
ncbi:hypothetical protein [Sulfitobacter sp. MOLA879]|uniref:hypothetical protein n=1 Tax=Sulfitobacter sp. MOLA879 TaxID=3368579 RepID=UPI0037474B0E